MSVAKKAISYILAEIVSILMISVILLITINSNILSKDNMRKSFKDSGYYYNLYGIIQESAENEVMPSGFEETVLDNVFTEEKLNEDIDTVIDCIYSNKKIEISTESIKQTLDANIQKEIQEKEYIVSDEAQASINEFEKAIIDTYTNHITYSENTINSIGGHIHKIQSLIKIFTIILCIAIIVLLVVLFFVNKIALGISFIISGVFFVALNLYSGTAVAVNNILLFNWAFSKTIIYILNNLLNSLFIAGMVLFLIGIIYIVIIEYINAKLFVKYKKVN